MTELLLDAIAGATFFCLGVGLGAGGSTELLLDAIAGAALELVSDRAEESERRMLSSVALRRSVGGR